MKNFIIFMLMMGLSLNAMAEIELSKMSVYIDANKGEDTIKVTNKGATHIIIYAEENKEGTLETAEKPLFYVSPMVQKLAPGQIGLVRVLQKEEALDGQKIGRISIREVNYTEENNRRKVSFVLNHDLPGIINPKGVGDDHMPWKKLKLEKSNKNNFVNNTKYVIKVMEEVVCIKNNKETVLKLDSSYILPKTKVKLEKNCDIYKILPIGRDSAIQDYYIVK